MISRSACPLRLPPSHRSLVTRAWTPTPHASLAPLLPTHPPPPPHPPPRPRPSGREARTRAGAACGATSTCSTSCTAGARTAGPACSPSRWAGRWALLRSAALVRSAASVDAHDASWWAPPVAGGQQPVPRSALSAAAAALHACVRGTNVQLPSKQPK